MSFHHPMRDIVEEFESVHKVLRKGNVPSFSLGKHSKLSLPYSIHSLFSLIFSNSLISLHSSFSLGGPSLIREKSREFIQIGLRFGMEALFFSLYSILSLSLNSLHSFSPSLNKIRRGNLLNRSTFSC